MPRHLQSCPVKDKICSKCGRRRGLQNVTRPTNVNYMDKKDEQDKEEQQESNIEPIAFAEHTTANGWETIDDQNSVSVINEVIEENNAFNNDVHRGGLIGHSVKLKTIGVKITPIADSASPMPFSMKKWPRN